MRILAAFVFISQNDRMFRLLFDVIVCHFDRCDNRISRDFHRFQAAGIRRVTISRPTLAYSVDRWPEIAVSGRVRRHFPAQYRNLPTK